MPISGLPLGVPPPQMIMPPGMMPGMLSGPPPLDKPPPIANMMAFGLHVPPTIAAGMQPNHTDDHMDIEMEDEHASKTDSVNFYSHPPPQLMTGNASGSGNVPGSTSDQRGDFRRGRDRNRSSSREKRDSERPQRGGDYRNRRDPSNDMEPRRGGMDRNRGDYQNDYNNGGNRRGQEIPSLLNVPMGQDDIPNRSNRNNG